VDAVEERFETRLDDGTLILFRRIRPDDKERLQVGMRYLSPESRFLRFFHHIDDLSSAQLRYLTEIDFEDHFAWIATMPERPGEPGVGVGRWIRAADDPAIAEGAVTVVDDFQNRGIGKTLLWLLARAAIQHGVHAFRAWTLGDNKTMLQMLEGFGARRGRWESGVLEVLVPLPDDVEDLGATPAPLVLKAAAAGDLHGEATDPQRPASTRFVPPPSIRARGD
jgi:GNAT superfamily N-acetyltransferase